MTSAPIITSVRTRRTDGERGQVLVLFVVVILVLLTSLALLINGGILRRSNQELWNALDAGALAGAASLPTDPATAAADARKFALANHPGLSASSLSVSFRCQVGDRNNDGHPDAGDVPGMCDPGPGATWVCAQSRCVAVCHPGANTSCNTVVVNGTVETDYYMSDITHVDGATTTFESAACSGLCGDHPVAPLDVALVLDRTSSMSAADLANVKTAAQAALRLFDPAKQHVALAVLGRSETGTTCAATANAHGVASMSTTIGTWVTVPYPTTGSLSTDYLSGASTLNNNSQLVQTIQCLNTSATMTNLGDPLTAIADTLMDRGRSGVDKGIIFMSDGAANQPNMRSCKYANDAATAVKDRGIEIYTIGFGITFDRCIDVDGPYANAPAGNLLADMATGPTSNEGCTDDENEDGDHYFCEPRSDSLTGVFRAAAQALLAGKVRLVHVPS